MNYWDTMNWLLWAFIIGVVVACILIWLQETYIIKFISKRKTKQNINKILERG